MSRYTIGSLCRNGHILTADSLYVRPSGVSRCRVCNSEANRRYGTKNKAKLLKKSTDWRHKNPDLTKYYARRSHLKIKFDISPEEADKLINETHGGKCDICCTLDETYTDSRGRQRHKLVIDHDHTSKKIRGVLCGDCNSGIGLLGDDPKRLSKAVEYLNKYGKEDN